MTILTIINNVLNRTASGEPLTTAYGATDKTARQAVAILNKTAQKVSGAYEWAELTKEYTFSTVSAQASYQFPDDMDYHLMHTHWNRNQAWPILGPMSPQEWQYRKSGIATSSPYSRYRVKGFTQKQFFIDPTPDTAEGIALEYQTKTCFLPQTWAASQSYTTNAYSFYDGNIYKTAAGGTTGATAPVHTTGSASDGTVTWSYQDAAYDSITADTDTTVLDEGIIEEEFEWRWLREKALPYEGKKAEIEASTKEASSSRKGYQVINCAGSTEAVHLVDGTNVPDSGLGEEA